MGEAAALLSAVTWSMTSIAMSRFALRLSATTLSAFRLVVVSLVAPLFLALSGQAGAVGDAPASALIAMVGSGILAYAIGDTIYFRALGQLGVQRTFPATMALFIALTVAGGVILLDEPFAWYQGVGGALVAVGVSLIVLARTHGREAIDLPQAGRGIGRGGLVLILLVGVLWAAATLWLAEGRGDMPSVAAWSVRTAAGAAGVLAFGLVVAPRDLAAPLRDRRSLAGMVAVALAGTAFGSLLYVYAVGEAGAARTSILNATAPLMALPLSIVLLKELPDRRVVVGTAACVAGIVLVVM